MRNHLREGIAVHDPPSDMTFTGLQHYHGHDRLCALVPTLALALRRDEAASARKALGSAGGEALATAVTVTAVAVTGAGAGAQTGAGVVFDSNPWRSEPNRTTMLCMISRRSLSV